MGVAFVGLASLMGVSPAITAGAAVSGAFLGDKVAKISDTFLLTIAVVGGVGAEEHGKSVRRTAIPTWIITAVLFLVLGLTQSTSGPDLIVRLSGDAALNYPEQVIKVGIATMAYGFDLHSGSEHLDQLFSGGGTWSMFETVWLILMASSFGAIVDYTGMIQRVIAPLIKWANGPLKLIFVTALSGIGLNTLAADPYVSIVLEGKMYRDEYIRRDIRPVYLSTMIADSGTMFSPLIPWNVHGAFVAGAMGVSVLSYAPYAFMCYLSVLVTMFLAYLTSKKSTLPKGVDAAEVYGEMQEELPEPQLLA